MTTYDPTLDPAKRQAAWDALFQVVQEHPDVFGPYVCPIHGINVDSDEDDNDCECPFSDYVPASSGVLTNAILAMQWQDIADPSGDWVITVIPPRQARVTTIGLIDIARRRFRTD